MKIWTLDEFKEYQKEQKKKRPKYRNVKTIFNDIKFHSKKEANRYRDLLMLQKMGEISNLKTQVPYTISVKGVKICKYVADFAYIDTSCGGSITVEDCKGFKTQVYKLKKKLMKSIHGIELLET